jgi:hypothetical protein
MNSFAAKNSIVKNIGTSAAPNFLIAIFGSYITLALTLILFVMTFGLIYIYFQNVGYTVDMGWQKLMNVFYNNEKIDISLLNSKKEVGSVSLNPAESPESRAIKQALGLEPPSAPGRPDPGFPPPPVNGSMPFNPDERPSGMPGARESTDEEKRKKRKRKQKRRFSISSIMSNSDSEKEEGGKEVFNVNRNLYTYEEAAPLCKAMGAELATYEQISRAQKKGADWCNYGWTKGQMAIFPTSKKTWAKLQRGPPEHRNSCGKPGVNGGFFDNPELRFGVNCFGERPIKKANDELLNDSDLAGPPTAEQIEFDKKVDKFREQLSNVSVLPWNRKKWSK